MTPRKHTLACLVGGICYDSGGVTTAMAKIVEFGLRRPPKVWRCPNAAAHPDRPYHLGRPLNALRPRRVA